MTATTDSTQSDEPVRRTVFYNLSRKILLASIGVAAIASDEISSFVNRLAERGDIAQQDARQLIKEILASREKLEKEQQEEQERQQIASSKAEIESLTNRVAELNKKIEELKKSQGLSNQGG